MNEHDAAIWTALIVAIPTMLTAVVVPIVLRLLDIRERASKEEREDLRASRIEAQAEEAARKADEAKELLKVNTAITRQAAVNATVSRTELATKTNDKLDEIHTIVNDRVISTLQAEFDAVTTQLAMMHEMIELKKGLHQEVSPVYLSAMEKVEARLNRIQDEMRTKQVTFDHRTK